MESRTRTGLIVTALALCTLGAGIKSAHQTGAFALLGGTPKISSNFWTDRNGATLSLKVRQFYPNGKPILNYDLDMQKWMHLVVIREDFGTFAHLHPAFDATKGTFDASFARQGHYGYYVYADSIPHGIGQQVFRFGINSDGSAAEERPSLVASSPYDRGVGPYTVILAKTTIAANRPQALNLTIVKGDDPADHLGTYLGAPAHVVLVDTRTLQYVHVHPAVRNETKVAGIAPSNVQSTSNGMKINMNMSGGKMISSKPGTPKSGPFMQLELPALPPGVYKMWAQFRGGGYKLYTAPFTLVAR